jgi:hypothetical protein
LYSVLSPSKPKEAPVAEQSDDEKNAVDSDDEGTTAKSKPADKKGMLT